MKGTLYSWHMKFRFFEESKRVHFYFALTIRYMVCCENINSDDTVKVLYYAFPS